MQAEKRPRKARQKPTSDIDVFSYIVEDIVDPAGKSTSWEAERSRVSKRAKIEEDPDEVETKSVRSRMSDSVISMNDSGYDSTSPTTYMKPRLGSLPENVFVENYEQLQRRQYDTPTQVPQPFPQGHYPVQYPYHYEYGPHQPSQQNCITTSDEPRRQPSSPNQTPLSGYDLLASRLSHSNDTTPQLPALYRRFTALNHRLLLQLQDEISEMETELHRLDDVDSYHRQDLPASRRADWGSGRLDLLSKIHMKLEHYHGAVLRLANVKAATHDPKPEDVETYRAYLTTHRPIQDLEMRFLDDITDLMSLDTTLPEGGATSLLTLPSPTPPTSALASPIPLQSYPYISTYNFTLLSSLASIWLLACVPSLFARWTLLLLLACMNILTQPRALISPISSAAAASSSLFTETAEEAWTRTKDVAVPLVFWMVVMVLC